MQVVFSLTIFIGLSIPSLKVQGATYSYEPFNNSEEISSQDEQNVQKKPFSWLLGTDSWGTSDPKSILPDETLTGCGGLVQLSTSLTYLFYEPSGGFGPNERCVWTLHGHLSKLEIYTDTQSSTTGANGLTLNYFQPNSTSSLIVSKIPTTNQGSYEYSKSDFSYLMFTSNEIGRGLGVRIAFREGGSALPLAPGHGWGHYTTASGSINLPYHLGAEISNVFQPPTNVHTDISIQFMDLELDHDFLKIFTLIPYHTNGNSITAISYTGFYPFGPPNSETSSEEPRIYYEVYDASVTKDGITLRWTSL